MKRLFTALDIIFNKVTKKDWDEVLVIAGYEGKGKSNLGLHILEWWLTKLYDSADETYIKNVSLDISGFVESLSSAKSKECLIFDEAGRLSNRRVMSKFNHALMQVYQVVRGDNLFTILILPSIFDLDPYFAKRRVRHLIEVYSRGKFAFWSQEKVRKIIELNSNRAIKKSNIVTPTFRDTFPKYTGVFKNAYDELKKTSMEKTRKELKKELGFDVIKDLSEKEIAQPIIVKMKDNRRWSFNKIGERLDIPPSTVKDWYHSYKKEMGVTTDE